MNRWPRSQIDSISTHSTCQCNGQVLRQILDSCLEMVCVFPKLLIDKILWNLAAQSGVQGPAGSMPPQVICLLTHPPAMHLYLEVGEEFNQSSPLLQSLSGCFPFFKTITYFSDGGLASHLS